ncbi:hypothetical protein SO802_021268 [Lithocarpus litseifolius]|uniref:Separase-like TPR repeats region domain-containing protein n=1 Tax=Lithocarpus litseifolius TaxID=425828 RepID=A0AAW2CET7_9ROSI
MAVEIRILHCWFWRWLQLATMVKCAAMGQSKDEAVYRRVIGLVEEVWPWLRVLDANAYENLHRALVTYRGKCTLFLVGELACFDGDLVLAFCYATISEFAKSSLKDQIYKVALRICSFYSRYQRIDRCSSLTY